MDAVGSGVVVTGPVVLRFLVPVAVTVDGDEVVRVVVEDESVSGSPVDASDEGGAELGLSDPAAVAAAATAASVFWPVWEVGT